MGRWLGGLAPLGLYHRSPVDLRAGSYEGAAALCLRAWVLSRNGHMVKLGLAAESKRSVMVTLVAQG